MRARAGGTRGIILFATIFGAPACEPATPRTPGAIVGTVAPPVAAPPAPTGLCSSAGYCWENPIPSGGDLAGVWASGPEDIVAVGDGGLILSFDGVAWKQQETGTYESLAGVWGSGPNDVYAVGNAGVILHRSGPGGAWRREHSGTEMSLAGVWGSGPNDVFAVGYAGAVLHFDGRQWASQDTGTTTILDAVWGSGPKDVYAVGASPSPRAGVVLHYDGAVWNAHPPFGNSLTAVWGTGPDDVFVAGEDESGKVAVWRLGSSGWAPQRVPGAGRALAMSGVGGHAAVLAVAEKPTDAGDLIPFGMLSLFVIEERDGAWKRRDLLSLSAPIGQSDWAFWGDGKGPAMLAGWWGTMGRLDDKGLQVNANAAAGKSLFGVWGRSPVDVYAVGVDGQVLHRDSQSWTIDPTGSHRHLTSVWGTDSSVVACGQRGTILVKEQGAWQERATGTKENLWAVWTSGAEIFAGGDNGTLVRCDAARCTSTSAGTTDPIMAIWGRNTHDVFAAGPKGTILHDDGTGWKPQKLPAEDLVGAIRGDGRGEVIATTPSGAYRLEGGVWSRVGDGAVWSLAETGDGGVLATSGGGGYPVAIRRFDGAAWHEEPLELGRYGYNMARLTGIWASAGEVFAVGDGGAILHKRR